MNNWCICWFSRVFLLGILIFKGLTARRLYKSFNVKRLMSTASLYATSDTSVAFLLRNQGIRVQIWISQTRSRGYKFPFIVSLCTAAITKYLRGCMLSNFRNSVLRDTIPQIRPRSCRSHCRDIKKTDSALTDTTLTAITKFRACLLLFSPNLEKNSRSEHIFIASAINDEGSRPVTQWHCQCVWRVTG
jgi:hypothetical protein